MAQLRKKLFGDISGAFGDAVYHEKGSLNYISQRPNSFIPGMDSASISRRAKFRITGKTASSIYSVDPLKELWLQETPPEMTAYNHIFSTNYRYVTDTSVSDMLLIVPDNGFGVNVTANVVDNQKVNVVIDPIGPKAEIDTNVETSLVMTCVLFLSQPLSEFTDSYMFLSLTSDVVPMDLTQQLTFDAEFTSQQSQRFDKYQDKKVFISIISLNAAGNPVHYSDTVLLP
jgi:hypothetical protein